ncbi:hypothetical protein GCM10023257_20670 [Streptomyces hyderabadensis]|uniref:Uncharacterized protein n=1 Tax=Streptomyces hyderabadensis TaxID=598549 RepID=A0ABP9HZG5_9ACTN
MYRPRMPKRMRLTPRRPLATAARARLTTGRADRGPAGPGPGADTPTPALDRSRTSARVPFVGGTAASTRVTAAPAPAPHPTHRVPKGGR